MPARKLEWKRIKKGDSEAPPLLITPLIDIMFLLLIFFVMNTSFNRLAPIEVNLPESSSEVGEIDNDMTLTLEKGGTILIENQQMSLSDLSEYILKNRGTNQVDHIIIAGDESISYDFLIKVMDEVNRSGINNITLITESL